MSDQGLTIRVDLSDLTDFAAALEKHPQEASYEIRHTVQMIVDTLEQVISGYTPVNTGLLRGSIATEIRGEPLTVLTGEVFTPSLYGEPVEYGRKAGKMPPVDAIQMWVERKLGVSPDESRQVAFLVARAIGRRGTKGAEMFKKGFERVTPIANRLFDELPEKLLKSLEEA